MSRQTLSERLATLEARRRVAAGCDTAGRPLYVRAVVLEADDEPPVVVSAVDARGLPVLTAAELAAIQADHLFQWQAERGPQS